MDPEKAQQLELVALHGRGVGPLIKMTLDEIIAEMRIAEAKGVGFTLLIGGFDEPLALTTHGWAGLGKAMKFWNIILGPIANKETI